jgi:hypothetical protein
MSSGRSTTKSLDDIWVLSLPQFQWTQVFAGVHPNYGSSCQLVGEKQMLFLGGVWGECRTPLYVALFDMTNLRWMFSFTKGDGAFRVPKAVWELIGGS